MLNKILILSLATIAFILNGCNSDGEGESRLETQHMLDKQDYEGVISKLASSQVKTQEENLALGAAYMGRAGLSLTDLVKVVSESGDNNDDNAFGSFISKVDNATQSSKSPLADLNKATQYYEKVVSSDLCLHNNNNLTDSQSDLCMFKGLTQIMGTATTIGYISDNVGTIFNTDGSIDSKLQASTCAMEYAIDKNSVENVCSITPKADVTFQSGLTYRDIDVYVDGEVFEYLLSKVSTVITKGYCSADDFTTRVKDKNSTNYNTNFHVCPINEDANATELTTGSIIAQALNDGIDAIGMAADDDMQEDIDAFKREVLSSSNKSSDATITEEDIVKYLNEQNQ